MFSKLFARNLVQSLHTQPRQLQARPLLTSLSRTFTANSFKMASKDEIKTAYTVSWTCLTLHMGVTDSFLVDLLGAQEHSQAGDELAWQGKGHDALGQAHRA